MTRFVVDAGAVLHLASDGELARSVEGIVATASIDAPRS